LATIVFWGAALLVSVWISRHLCNEIDHLRDRAARVAAGDYSIALNVESKDEIGDLARSFQEMAVLRQKAERMKDEFFANVSHELRTPLTLILSPLESLLGEDHGNTPPRVKIALDLIHNNAVRLLQLVNGLLDFAKLEAGKIQVHREPLPLSEITEMIYQDFQPLMRSRNLEARLAIDAPGAIVMMDRYM